MINWRFCNTRGRWMPKLGKSGRLNMSDITPIFSKLALGDLLPHPSILDGLQENVALRSIT